MYCLGGMSGAVFFRCPKWFLQAGFGKKFELPFCGFLRYTTIEIVLAFTVPVRRSKNLG